LELLGVVDAELLFDTVDAVIAEDPKAVLLGVEEMARSGRDPSQFARDLLAHLRHLLVTQTIGEVPNTFVVTATDQARLQAQAQAIGAATLVRTIDELAQALTAVREGDDARMAVEIALLKAARPDLDPSTEGLLRRIERLEQGTKPSPAAGLVAAGDPPPPAVATSPTDASEPDADDPPAGGDGSGVSGQARRPVASPSDSASDESSAGEQPSAGPDTPGPASGPAGGIDLDQLTRVWPAVLDQLLQTAPALAATFDGARPIAFDEGELTVTIGFPADHTFNKRKAEAPDKREQLAAALETVLGGKVRPAYAVLDGDADAEATEARADGPQEQGGVDHEALVEKIKSEFDAEEVG
jgi:DNA polymerase-3 subunit gamma/tau